MATYKVDQNTANELLYKAWKANKKADFFATQNDSWENAMLYASASAEAKAFYDAWSMITNIELKYGCYSLRKFTEDDFTDFASADRGQW